MPNNRNIGWEIHEIIGISDINAGTIYSIRFLQWIRNKLNISPTIPAHDILDRSDINDLFAEFKVINNFAFH